MPSGEPPPDDRVDPKVDRLFELAPEEFTAARDRLAHSLRESGDREAAARVKALRRPTVAAWALNQVARRHHDDVTRLIDTGARLRQAQRKALSGLGGAAMRDAQRQRRTAVDRLVERAADALRELGAAPDAHAIPIRRALEGASIDDAAGQALLEARLSQPPESATGFDMVEGLQLVAEPAGDEGSEPASGREGGTTALQQDDEAARQAAQRRAEAEGATARLAAAQRAAESSLAEARARRRDADGAARTAADADAEAERLARQLDAARDRAWRSAKRAERAAARAREAEEAAERRERERGDAQADVDRLDGP